MGNRNSRLTLVLVGLIFAGVLASRQSTPIGEKTSPSQTLTWHEVKQVTGQGIKETELFTIRGDEWRISWDYRGDANFQVLVYKANGQLVNLVANGIGPERDSSMMHGSGSYYIGVAASGRNSYYVVTIEDKY